MTKRWLSLVLVFTLFSTLFTGVAFAADKTVTVEPASDFVVSAGDAVYQQNIGTIKVDGNSIGTEDWTALQGKILVTATGMSVSNAVATLDQQGGILVSFAVPSTGAADAQFEVSLNSATGYSMGTATKGAKVTLATVPVGQVVVQQYNEGTTKFSDVSALEITTETLPVSNVYTNRLYVGTTPETASADTRKLSVSVGDSSIVGYTALAGYSNGDAPALTDYFDLVGKKPGSTTVTVTAANGVSKTINVTVKETTIESFTLEYKTNGSAIAQSSNELEVGETAMPTLTLTPAYATQKAMTYTISGDDNGVIELNTSTGMVTALKEGSATVKATPVYGTAGAQEFTIYTKARTGSNVTAPVFTVKASATEMAGANGTSGNPYTEPVTVEISCATANTTIYYTIDGTAPGITSTQYTAPIEIAATAANDIKAIAVSNDGKLTSATQTLSKDNLVIALRPLQLTLDQTAMNVTGATAFTLNATVTPEFAKLATSKNTFTWTSSNQDVIANGDIATSNNGLTATATPKAAGSTVITITSTADATVKAECKVTVADSKATGITLDKSSATLPTNEYLQLTATVTPSTALDKKVTWMTSNNAIATVADGLVTPIAKGTVVITAKIGTAYATCQVTVTDTATKVSAPVFTVAKASGEAVSGNNFAETGYVVTATSQTDGSTVVLTVYKDGAKVKAAGTDTYTLDANGTYTMSAYATKSGMESSDVVDATYVVSVPVKTVTIGNEASQETKGTFNATAKTLSLNGLVSYKLNATVNPANADVGTPAVTWTSSNPSVAEIYSEAKTIDGTSYAAGEVIAKSEGTATITATTTGAAEAKTDSITVTVKPVKVTGITMPTITTPKVNQQVTLKATVAPAEATNPAVTWAIVTRADSTGEATIAGDVITFTKAGKIYLTATATDGSGINAEKDYTIGADDGTVVAPSVSIDGTEVSGSATITVAGKATMSTITMGSSIYYTTDGKTPSATVGTLYSGEFELPTTCTTLKAIAIKDGRSSTVTTITITWDVKPSTITLTPSKAQVELGETFTVQFNYEPATTKASYKTYTLDANANVDVVSTNTTTGIVTLKVKDAATLGKTTLQTTSAGVTGKCDITISKVAITGIEITAEFEGEMAIGSTNKLTATVVPSNAVQDVTWSSSNTAVATVDASGKVTALQAGTAVITARSTDDLTTTATYTVTVAADPTEIPAVPTTRPVLTTLNNKSYEVLEDGSSRIALAQFNAADMAAIKYYYQPVFTVSIPGFTGTATISVAEDGVVYLVVKNAKPATTFTFSYTWALNPLTNRVPQAPGFNAISVTGNTLKVVAKPTAINFTAATVADTTLEGGATATLDLGTIANYADFTATGVAVTATANVSGEGIAATAAIDSNGKVTANVEGLKQGEYTVTVTLTAEGCTAVTTSAAKVTVTSDKPVEPTERAIVVAMGTAYEGMKGVLQLSKAEQRVTFDVTGLTEGQTVTWKSSKPAYVSIDEHGIATLKKAGKATITATISDGSKLTLSVNVNKGSFADPANIKLQTKPNSKWVDVTAEGITVVPKKSGAKNVPSRLTSSDDGKIVIQDIEFSDGTIASRAGDNPAPIKVKKRSISDGKTTTLTITANGAKFSVVIKVDSTAKDVYLEEAIAQIEEIVELEAE